MKPLRPLHLATCLSAILFSANTLAADFVFLDEATLEQNRAVLQSDKASDSMKDAYDRLIEEAELAMKDGPFTVTAKGMTPPSGSKNDYMSISRTGGQMNRKKMAFLGFVTMAKLTQHRKQLKQILNVLVTSLVLFAHWHWLITSAKTRNTPNKVSNTFVLGS